MAVNILVKKKIKIINEIIKVNNKRKKMKPLERGLTSHSSYYSHPSIFLQKKMISNLSMWGVVFCMMTQGTAALGG